MAFGILSSNSLPSKDKFKYPLSTHYEFYGYFYENNHYTNGVVYNEEAILTYLDNNPRNNPARVSRLPKYIENLSSKFSLNLPSPITEQGLILLIFNADHFKDAPSVLRDYSRYEVYVLKNRTLQ